MTFFNQNIAGVKGIISVRKKTDLVDKADILFYNEYIYVYL